MAHVSRTWWGQRFIAALEQFTDPGRLGRGRSYAHNGRILDYTLERGTVTATVRGSINPYFGVYDEPRYRTTITMQPIAAAEWATVIAQIAARADLVTKLLLGEMPDRIEEVFSALGLHLLPHSQHEFKTNCSCPDYANPCKHIAGVYYLLAASLDHDPFVMFELRGLSRDHLRAELGRSSLGQILSSALVEEDVTVASADSYYIRPAKDPAPAVASHKEFWTGAKRLPALTAPPSQPHVSALLVKSRATIPPSGAAMARSSRSWKSSMAACGRKTVR